MSSVMAVRRRIMPRSLEWQLEGLCFQTHSQAFYPPKGSAARVAKKLCEQCPVREQCLEYALDNDERFGIWGGLSERERRQLKRERREAAQRGEAA